MPSPLAPLFAALTAVAAVSVPGPAGTPQGSGEPVPSAHVVAVSVDGLNPEALRMLGPEGSPVLHDLMHHGAATLDARTERELTDTLPNHVGMVTGRRVDAARGGHGVTWNDGRLDPPTVQAAAGHEVQSVFSVVHEAGGSTGLFASKEKLTIFDRSWPDEVDRTVVRTRNLRLVRVVARDLEQNGRDLTFVHLSLPDVVGHRAGFMSASYLDAVSRVDGMVGSLMAAVEGDPELRGTTTMIVTADHGGLGAGHSVPTELANYRVPFLVWGAGVAPGTDLYELNPGYAEPGPRRTRYSDERPPVRNGAVANLTTDLLGLGPVPGSEHDAVQDLDVR